MNNKSLIEAKKEEWRDLGASEETIALCSSVGLMRDLASFSLADFRADTRHEGYLDSFGRMRFRTIKLQEVKQKES